MNFDYRDGHVARGDVGGKLQAVRPGWLTGPGDGLFLRHVLVQAASTGDVRVVQRTIRASLQAPGSLPGRLS